MKNTHILIIVMVISSCSHYKDEEIKAISDIANDYLVMKNLPEIRNEFNFFGSKKNPFIDTTNLKVYISNGLLPISQIRDDNTNLFRDTLEKRDKNNIYHLLINSKRFKNLEYCLIETSKIKLTQPYYLISSLKDDLRKYEIYVKMNFSRICFDRKFEYGIVYLDYNSCHDNGSSGKLEVLLIQKVNKRWIKISDKE